MQLPHEGRGCDLVLTIEARGECEQWARRFGEQNLSTTQWAGKDGLLHERFGPLEFGFELRTEGGTLMHIQRSAALKIAGMTLRLPSSLAPDVRGSEYVDDGKTRVEVEVRIPVGGMLLRCSGTVLSVQPT